MLVVVVLSGALAVLQSSPALAALGTTGGFLAPILASTGSGSHVSLFTYYLILNAGVVGLAWFRAWRMLNWLGFVFTFGVGLFWGSEFYQPALFATTEPFLIAFFLFYVAVVVLFALRQPPNLRGYIDGSLTFGMPAIAFTMQSRLVGDIPFGRAYSAVAVSALYLVLARGAVAANTGPAGAGRSVPCAQRRVPDPGDPAGLRRPRGGGRLGARRRGPGLGRIQPEPAAGPDGRRAAALRRRHRVRPDVRAGVTRPAGAQQRASWAARPSPSPARSAAYQYFRFADRRRRWEAAARMDHAGVGSAVVGRRRPDRSGRRDHRATMVPALSSAYAATAVVLAAIARWRTWPALAYFCLPFLPMLALLAVGSCLFDGQPGPWSNGGWAAWPAAMLGSFLLLWLLDARVASRRVTRVARRARRGCWFSCWRGPARPAMNLAVPESSTWSQVMWALVPVAVGLALVVFAPRLPWPVRAHPEFYATRGPAAPLGGALLWTAWADHERRRSGAHPLRAAAESARDRPGRALVVTVIWAQRAGGISSAIRCRRRDPASGRAGRRVRSRQRRGWPHRALLHGRAVRLRLPQRLRGVPGRRVDALGRDAR